MKTYSEDEKIQYFEMLAQRFTLMPLQGKEGFLKAWSQWCYTSRPFQREEYIDKNAGILCGPGNGLIVLDVDDEERFKQFMARENHAPLPATFMVQSRPGRWHFYFAYPNDGRMYCNRSIKEDGYDIRGLGGYIVAPGSIHPETGDVYTPINELPIAAPPQWLLDVSLKETPPPEPAATASAADVDLADESLQPVSIAHLPEDLQQAIMTSVAKGNRSEAEMSVIFKCVRHGLDDTTILAIMEHYPIGEKHREKGDARFHRMQQQIDKARGKVSTSGKFVSTPMGVILDKNPQIEFLVENLWVMGESLMLYGQGGTGKSLMAMQLMLDLVSEQETKFLGTCKVKPDNRVLLLQSEVSAAGLNERMRAMCNGSIPEAVRTRINVVTCGNEYATTGNFLDKEYCNNVHDMLIKTNSNVLIVDPLISYHNVNENENAAMRKLLDAMQSVSKKANASLLIIHHSGKQYMNNKSTGSRGASAIGDWASSSLELSVKSVQDSVYVLTHVKARDMQQCKPMTIKRFQSLRYTVYAHNQDQSNEMDRFILQAYEQLKDKSFTGNELIRQTIALMTQTSDVDIPSESTVRRKMKKLIASNQLCIQSHLPKHSVEESASCVNVVSNS